MIRSVKDITSAANPSFKMWRSLLKSNGISRNCRAIVSGSRIVSDLLNGHPEIVESCIVCDNESLSSLNLPERVERFCLDPSLFRELDIFGTNHPLLVVRVSIPEPYVAPDLPPAMTLFIPFQDPTNVGAVVRSAVAFGIHDIVLTGEAASPYHPRSIRASGGSVFTASFTSCPYLKEMSTPPIPVYGLSADGRPLNECAFPKVCALLPGIEGPGLPHLSWLADTISIPMEPGIESLNAAVATSIAMYVWRINQNMK